MYPGRPDKKLENKKESVGTFIPPQKVGKTLFIQKTTVCETNSKMRALVALTIVVLSASSASADEAAAYDYATLDNTVHPGKKHLVKIRGKCCQVPAKIDKTRHTYILILIDATYCTSMHIKRKRRKNSVELTHYYHATYIYLRDGESSLNFAIVAWLYARVIFFHGYLKIPSSFSSLFWSKCETRSTWYEKTGKNQSLVFVKYFVKK